MVLENNKWTAVGIVSSGIECGDRGHPGIYPDISYYQEWIEDQIR